MAPASARCAATPTCRATAPSASPRSPTPTLLDRLERDFGFKPPREHGHGAVEAIKAISEGRSKALVCLGGNLPVAMSDPRSVLRGDAQARSGRAYRHQAQPLASAAGQDSRSFCRASAAPSSTSRQTGPQSVTVEDSMSMVHASRGGLKPASDRPQVGAGDRRRHRQGDLAEHQSGLGRLVADYDTIRDAHREGVSGLCGLQSRACASRAASACTSPPRSATG